MGARIEVLDLEFGQTPHAIAAFLVLGPEGPVLVESGPGSTLVTLVAKLEQLGVTPGEVRHVLVTHIHLDHAGAAGWWAQQGATIYVHPLGAPHLIDPSRLWSSAGRIYGDQMETLWGEMLPAPAERVVAVEDGDTVAAGGLRFTALATPGHARHHHVYRLGELAFTGDATGIRLPDVPWIDLPAPPPEFELEVWKETLGRLREERFETIYRTHFGPATEVAAELDRFEEVLDEAAAMVRQMLREDLDREAMIERYSELMRRRAAAEGIEGTIAKAYELANPRFMSVDGIVRYWRKQETR